tara:strand:- start:1879 stop:2925 length:1047 start_codon:yes stop_codon:yes gene_type:complete
MLTIDASYGGGQVIRTALALSTLLKKPFKAVNIRKNRPKSGLKAQHLTCIETLKELCNAEVKGNVLESKELEFHPKNIEIKDLEIDIGTAGSITLLMQSLLLPIICSKDKINLKIIGGTHGLNQMPIEYFKEVFIPHITKYIEKLDVTLLKRGYFPKGQGEVEISITPKEEPEGEIKLLYQGKLIQIKGISHASKDLENAKVAERQSKTARLNLKKLNCHINLIEEYQDTKSTGSGMILYAIFSLLDDEIDFKNPIILGSDINGKKGKKAELIGNECSNELIKTIKSKAPVDKYLADNLIPFLAIFGGKIKVEEVSEHTLANIKTCELFLDKKFEIKNNFIRLQTQSN